MQAQPGEHGKARPASRRLVDASVGNLPYAEPVLIPASSHAGELDDVVKRIEDIESQLTDPSDDQPTKALVRVLGKLEDRRAELEAIPVTEARVELRKTGKTVSEEWESADKNRRRKILGEIGAKLTVWYEDGKLRINGETAASVLGWSYQEN